MISKEKSIANKLYIDCQAIADNYSSIRDFVGDKVICAANIKSNAYGLGLMQVMRCLSKAGCNKFFVGTLEEAIELRNYSLTDEIYVLNGLAENQQDEFAQHNIIPVLNTLEQFEMFNSYCIRKNKKFSAALNIDTGSKMVGIPAEIAIKLAKENHFKQKTNIRFILSHFASIPYIDNPYNIKQKQIMEEIKELFNLPVSLANSTAIMENKNYNFDMIRIGSILYGVSNNKNLKLRNAITLTSKIIQIREATEDFINIYDKEGILNKSSIIATIPIGYGDGLLPALSNKSVFYVHGHPAPVIGKIFMDFTMLDITNIPQYHRYAGAEVEIIGQHSSVNTIAKAAGTFANHIILSLSPRIHRIYK